MSVKPRSTSRVISENEWREIEKYPFPERFQNVVTLFRANGNQPMSEYEILRLSGYKSIISVLGGVNEVMQTEEKPYRLRKLPEDRTEQDPYRVRYKLFAVESGTSVLKRRRDHGGKTNTI